MMSKEEKLSGDLSPFDVPLADLVGCARKELTLRKTLYPQMVKNGRMSATEMDSELLCMRAIVGRLEAALELVERVAQIEMVSKECRLTADDFKECRSTADDFVNTDIGIDD